MLFVKNTTSFDHNGRSYRVTVKRERLLSRLFLVRWEAHSLLSAGRRASERGDGVLFMLPLHLFTLKSSCLSRTVLWCGCHRESVHHPSLQKDHIYQIRHSSWEFHKEKSGVVEATMVWSPLFSQFCSFTFSLSLSFSFSCLLVALSLFHSHSSPNFNTPVSSSMALWPMCSCLLDCLVLEVFVLMSRHTFSDWFGFFMPHKPQHPLFCIHPRRMAITP